MVGRGRGGRRGGRGVRSQRESLNNDGYLQSQQNNAPSRKCFSLNEEAQYTERHHLWNSDLKLRHSRVAFVSAGTSSAEELTKAPQKDTTFNSNVEAKDKETASVTRNHPTAPIATLEAPMSKVSLSDAPFAGASESGTSRDPESTFLRTSGQSQLGQGDPSTGLSNDVFFTDLKGAGQCTQIGLMPPVTTHSPSPAASDSGDEIILFVGRRSNPREPHKTTSQTIISDSMSERKALTNSPLLEAAHRSMATIIDDPIGGNTNDSTAVEQHTLPDQQMPTNPNPTIQHTQDLGNGDLTSIPGKRRRGRRRKRQWQAEDEAQIMADYIANTNESDDLDAFSKSFGLNQRDLVGSDIAEWEDEEAVSVSEQKSNVPSKDLNEWDVADLQDFDDISTSSEALDSVKRVLLSRQRPSGVQYLVVGHGHKVDDARWLSLAALDVPGADEKVRIFEEEQVEVKRLLDEGGSSEQSMSLDEQLALDAQGNMEDLEDEEDLVGRRRARLTDEQIARLLSKQEELGLGSEDLRLFDGCDFSDGDEVEAQLDGMWDEEVNFQDQTKTKRRKQRAQPNFPSATALANTLDRDPYNGFDIMDQDRPSLRRKQKGRHRNLPMELSDSELELQIHMAWENDRSKKKKCKKEREELRAQGLLGKKGNPDLKARYTEGMSIVELKSEIKDFLLSSTESLSLPPMAQRERKMVHEIAHVFKLKSKSIGSGTSRFPVLYRTSRTTQYDEDASGTIEALLSSRRFLPRMDKGKRKKGSAPTKARGGGFASAGVSYRDGEIVGAAAPELGQDNKGRAMLEKMGWSSGTTLGALNNDRGIVQPVAQVVKTGKAGLG